MKIRRFVWWGSVIALLLVAAAAGSYAWYYFSRPCEVAAVRHASDLLVSQMKRYDDVYTSTAAAPSRSSITYPVSVLQQILMDTQQIAVPACMRTAKSELIAYMGAVIRAFQAYSMEETDLTIGGLLNDSYAHVRNFINELDAVNKCAPVCLPF